MPGAQERDGITCTSRGARGKRSRRRVSVQSPVQTFGCPVDPENADRLVGPSIMSYIYDSTPSDKPSTLQLLSSARFQFRDTLHFQVVLLLLVVEHKAATSVVGRLHSSRAPLLSSLLSVPQFPTIDSPAGLQHQRVIDNSPILRTNPLHTYPATSFPQPQAPVGPIPSQDSAQPTRNKPPQ